MGKQKAEIGISEDFYMRIEWSDLKHQVTDFLCLATKPLHHIWYTNIVVVHGELCI